MRKILCALLLATTGFATPPACRVRVYLKAPDALVAEKSQLRDALLRGLYGDSLIVPGPDSLVPFVRRTAGDTALYRYWTPVMIVDGELEESGGLLVARLRLANILMRTVLGPDTIRLSRASLDSAGVARGKAYARYLARTIHIPR